MADEGAQQRGLADAVAPEPGKVTCVLGRNGVGKTSLLRPSTQVTLPGSAEIETPRSACAAP